MQKTFTIIKTKKQGLEIFVVTFGGRLVTTRHGEAGARTVCIEKGATNIVMVEV